MEVPGIPDKVIADVTMMSRSLGGVAQDVYNVWTGQPFTQIKTATLQDMRAGVLRARLAQQKWAELTAHERSDVLTRLNHLVFAKRDLLLAISGVTSGKCWLDAADEVHDALSSTNGCARMSRKVMVESRGIGSIPFVVSYRVIHEPLGVVGFFTHADTPVASVSDVLQPLTAGNAVVQFVPMQGAFAAYLLRQMAIAAGLPEELWQIMPSDSRDLGCYAIQDCDFVSFIGDTETGYAINKLAQEVFVPSALFLSVKNVGVVTSNANLKNAVRGICRAAFYSAGQAVLNLETVYVDDAIYDDFKAQLVQRLKSQYILDADYVKKATVSSLYSRARLRRVQDQVTNAIEEGGKLVYGGNARPDIGPLVFEPTILEDLPDTAFTNQDEIYGPVLILKRYTSLEDVIIGINSSPYGQYAVIYSTNMYESRAICEQLQVGAISINDAHTALFGTWQAPIEGRAETGNGIRHGLAGIQQYTQRRSIVGLKWGSLVPVDITKIHSWGDRVEYRVLRRRSFVDSTFTYSALAQGLRVLFEGIRHALWRGV